MSVPAATRSSFAVDVPAHGVLRFAIAAATLTKPAFRTPIAFMVRVKSDEGDEGESAKASSSLLRKRTQMKFERPHPAIVL